MSPAKKKVKIELEDAEGGKYNLSLEGNISKSKVMKIFEVMELLDVKSQSDDIKNDSNSEFKQNNLASIGDKIWYLVENKFTNNTFTSSDIVQIYEHEYHENIQLSIISTYLSRYAERGKLSRNRKGKEWVYKIIRHLVVENHSSEKNQYDHSSQHLSYDVPSTVYDLHR